MDRLMQGMYNELGEIKRDPYINREDRERGQQRVKGVIISYKQNELMQVMNSVASKYMKWSTEKLLMITIYILLSLLVMVLNFVYLKKLLLSEDLYAHVYAILISVAPALFHFYVLNFREIPFFDIDISENEPMIYLSLAFGYLTGLPYMIARRIYR